MPVNERLEDPGSFTVRLDAEKIPYDELRLLQEMGHIVITPQWHQHPELFAEADLLTAAKYSGVLLEVDNEVDADGAEMIVLRGQGNVWHLGDDYGHGPILAEDRTYTAAAITDVLKPVPDGGILPPAIKVGTITTTGVGTFPPSGTVTFYASQFCYECVRTVMDTMGMTFHIPPNWELDACLATRDDVYVTTSPTVVAVPKGFGSDPTYIGVEPDRVASRVDATRWVSRSVNEAVDAAGKRSILNFKDRSYNPYQDPHGNALVRNHISTGPSSDDVGHDTFHDRQLETNDTAREQELDLSQMDLSGPFKVGDWIWVYDPSRGFIDTDNQIFFRGMVLAPLKMRVTEDEWAILSTYGVYYRPASVRYRQAVLADGPVAYWRLDETSGTTAADSSGNGFDLTYQNTPTLNVAGLMQDGSGSTAVTFTRASSEWANRANTADLEFLGTSPFTVECWVNWSGVAADQQLVHHEFAATGGWQLYVDSSGLLTIDRRNGGSATVATAALSSGVRHHVVGVYDGASLRLYIDGSLAASVADSLSLAAHSSDFSIAAFDDPPGGFLDGTLDEVAVYDSALSETRIRLHNAIGRQGLQAGRWIDLTRYVIPEAA